jgi:sugar-phosphatase
VKHGKPAPDAYLLGAERLGLPPGVRGGGRCAGGAALRPGGRLSHHRGQRACRCPRLDEADLVLSSLEDLVVERQTDGVVNVRLKA